MHSRQNRYAAGIDLPAQGCAIAERHPGGLKEGIIFTGIFGNTYPFGRFVGGCYELHQGQLENAILPYGPKLTWE
jgi:hypothetical protein